MYGTKVIYLGIGVVAAAMLAPGVRAEDVTIGYAGPLTGQLAALGDQVRRGTDLAVADLNAKGGILGQKVVIEYGDDQCDPKQAVSVANQFVGKKVSMVVGHVCSGSSIPAADVYREEGTPMITPSATNPAITDKGYPNVFRTLGRDDQQGTFAGEYIAKHFKDRTIAILHDKQAYGKGVAEQTKAQLNKLGVKEVLFDSINAGEKDFRSMVSRLKSLGVNFLYYGGYHPEAGLLIRQAHEQGMNLQMMGGDGLNTSEYTAVAGADAEGTLLTFAPDARNSPEGKDVAERLRKQGFEPEGYTLYAYAAVQVFAQGAEKAKSLKHADVDKVLHAGDFKTVVGDISYDAKGDLKSPKFDVFVWKGGKAEPLPK